MFSIGAFSRLAQLSVRRLRHYDEIGLLKPVHVNSNSGVRYYAAEQLVEVNQITALKALGLSLVQVQLLIKENHSTDAIAGMLRLEMARAERERNEAERKLQDLQRKLAELGDLGRLSEIEVVEKSVPAMPFLAFRTKVGEVGEAYMLMHEIVARCEPLGPWGPLIAVAYDRFFDTRNLDIELGYSVERPSEIVLGSGRRMTQRKLPAVDRMLSVMYVGTQEDGHRVSHQALALWLQQHQCELAGPGRELTHSSTGAPRPTIEIQYPITDLPRR
jgi:DNA-binding transcriptional MerR regulator